MNWRLGLTLIMLLAAIASGWSVWQFSHQEEEALLHTRSDYILRNYDITSLDKQGQEAFTLRGPELHRDPKDSTLSITTPQFLIPDRERHYWDVRAKHGVVAADGSQLLLHDDVQVDSPPEVPPPTRINTTQLTFLLKEKRAQTAAEVTITRPGLTMRGLGLDADFDRHQIALLSKVHARYAPQH